MLQSIYTHAGCDYGCLYTYSPRHCFNPHTHAGCDNVHNVSGASFPVSIHTPTQGVTFLYICNVFRICFNPHTHAGCDNPLPRLTRVHNRFNPHTHAGCDTISFYSNTIILCFNPHTHAGCDSAARPKVLTVARFQSTHPRRVWPHRGHTASSAVCFNPHTHAGCDGSERYKEIEALVSIHTPTQGVTSGKVHPTTGHQFQSTHPRRVWHHRAEFPAVQSGFNPHTHAGCDYDFGIVWRNH